MPAARVRRRRGHREQDVAIHAARFLGRHVLVDVEVTHLAAEAHRLVRVRRQRGADVEAAFEKMHHGDVLRSVVTF